ncbi:protein DA1 [Lentzea sp. NPDC004789]
MRCAVCGRQPVSCSVSLRGQVICDEHGESGLCVGCARPRAVGEQGWPDLGAGVIRCPECAVDAVDTQHDVRRVLPGIRRTAGELGFTLRTPVRVVLADGERLRSAVGGALLPLGITEIAVSGDQMGATVIRVLGGQPHDLFGGTVSHELGHAWLAENSVRLRTEALEEGVCELIAYAWLKKAGTPFALALRDRMRHNPNPVYGAGFRLVHGSVRMHGMAAVLSSLARTGGLP